MSTGLAVQLPLTQDNIDGFYLLIQDYTTLARQNLTMLLLTNPGERIMDPNFGVGLRRYLFSLNAPSTFSTLRGNIDNQVQKYLPFIGIEDVKVQHPAALSGDVANTANVMIYFRIIPLQFQGVLQIDVDNN